MAEMTRKSAIAVVTALESWGKPNGRPTRSKYGICYNISSLYIRINGDDFVKHYAKGWEHLTDYPGYPIPQTVPQHSPATMYSHTELWGRSKYANLRRDLCLFMAARVRLEYQL